MNTRLLLSGMLVLLCVPSHVLCNDAFGKSSTAAGPRSAGQAIVFSDERAAGLYLATGDSTTTLALGSGCGRYFTVSPSLDRVGFKLIGPQGQTPCVVNLRTGLVSALYPPSPRAGQVSIADDGATAFTIGDSLVVLGNESVNRYFLASYANIAPISADGRRVVYNDAGDQLWVLRLASGERTRITRGPGGFMLPQWAPDGSRILFTALDGTLAVYDCAAHTTVTLGQGYSASWSARGDKIIFYRKEVRGDVLVNADIWVVDPDGAGLRQLTSTPGVIELDPSFSADGSSVLFTIDGQGGIHSARLAPSGSLGEPRVAVAQESITAAMRSNSEVPPLAFTLSASSTLDVPYINQVYDTPDWFNGHSACAAAAAMTVLAYYSVLPRWDVGCSTGGYHISPWGRYICESYRFREFPYAVMATDPNGAPSYGGYGYMWASGSPYTTMASYYSRHGLWAKQTDYPPLDSALAEINAGYPYSMCVGLTSAGHLIVAHGVGAEPHTLVFNDPYGNKNLKPTYGYPNNRGKDVQYDWPGYNNGHENLNQVFWCIAVHASPPMQADTLVDDLQFDHGFTMSTQAPGSFNRWLDKKAGYGGHFWYTKTTGTPGLDTCYATWRPDLPADGDYEVQVYIPFSNATSAMYRIASSGGSDTVVVNQKQYKDSWVSLGVHHFNSGAGSSLYLGDGTGEPGQEIVFDAVRWLSRGTAAVASSDVRPEESVLLQNYPNPFNPSTTIVYTLTRESRVELTICNLLGQTVSEQTARILPPGRHSETWNALNSATGVYIVRLKARPLDGSDSHIVTRRILLLR